jgi:transposase
VFKKYFVRLTDEQERTLLEMVSRGTAPARTIRRAHMLLLSWEGRTDEEIAGVLRCCTDTVADTRRAFEERGLASVYDRPRPGRARKLDGRAEAHLVALACTDPPDERKIWTMQLLADQLVTLGLVDSISDETVRRVLKNRRSSRG